MGWLIVFRPPPPFGGQPPQSRENEKTPSMVGEGSSKYHANRPGGENFTNQDSAIFFS